jgi:hypothetical protein
VASLVVSAIATVPLFRPVSAVVVFFSALGVHGTITQHQRISRIVEAVRQSHGDVVVLVVFLVSALRRTFAILRRDFVARTTRRAFGWAVAIR